MSDIEDEGRYAEYHIGWQEGYAEAKSEAAAEITRLREKNVKLRKALVDCKIDLEVEINARYQIDGKVHPALQHKYDNDMSTVISATKVIEETGDEWEACRGIAPDATGEMSSEEFIRKERDQW